MSGATLKTFLDHFNLTKSETTVRGLRLRVMEARNQTQHDGQYGPYARQGVKLTDDSAVSYASIWDGPSLQAGQWIAVEEGKLSQNTGKDGKVYINFNIRGEKMTVEGGGAAPPPATGAPSAATAPATGAMSFEDYWALYDACLGKASGIIGAILVETPHERIASLALAKDMATSAMIAYVRDRAFQPPPLQKTEPAPEREPGSDDEDPFGGEPPF